MGGRAVSRPAYLAAGPEDAPVVALLHAIATDASVWMAQIGALQSRYRVVAIDLPGHGANTSVPTATPSIEALALAVLQTCDALGVDRAAFVGLSLGSMVAQWIAANRPERVAAAVFACGACTLPEAGRQAWRDRIASVATGGIEPQLAPTLERWFTPGFRKAAPFTVSAIAALVRATSIDSYIFAATAIAALDQAEMVRRIACPTLVIAGEQDQATPMPALELLTQAIPGARLATLPTAHLANIEAAVAFTELVGSFLRETLP